MKFKCGPTAEEKEAAKLAKKQRLTEKYTDLLKHGRVRFAWLPVKTKDGDCRWLEPVREVVTSIYFDDTLECYRSDRGYGMSIKDTVAKMVYYDTEFRYLDFDVTFSTEALD